jgi:hypothetical protein
VTPQEELEYLRLKKRKAMATQGQPPAPSMAGPTAPDFMNGGMDLVSDGGPQSLGDMKIPGLQDYIVQNMQEQRDAEAQRKQLDQTATQAGFEARGQAAERMGVNSPLMQAAAAPALALAQQEGGRQVFNEAGVMLPDEAAGTTILNAQGVGIPGFVSSEMRDKMRQAYEDQPGWALTGEIAASYAPGEALFQGSKTAYNALAKPFVTRMLPKGGSSVARGTRLATHGVEQVGAWAGQNAFYQGTTGASSRAAQEGRAPTLSDVTEGAKAGATDPLNLAGPAATIALNRMATFIRSGGTSLTPTGRAAEVSRQTRGGSLPATERAGQVLGMDVLGTELRPQAVQRVVNLLSVDMAPEDIAGLFESVQQRLSSLPEAEAGRLTLGQALLDALDNPETSQAARQFPQAAFNLRQSLRNASLGGELGNPRRGDRRAGIVGGVREELQGSQTDYVSGKIDSALGDKRLINIDDQVAEAKAAIGQQYDSVLAQADPNRPEAKELTALVIGDQSKGILKRRAKNSGFLTPEGQGDVDAYAAARPDEAAHWLRSALSKASRKAQGREAVDLQNTVDELDALLETNAGYADARRAYGSEMGIDDAVSFGDRFVASAKNEYATDRLIRELEGMSDAERGVALLSIRNNLKSYLNGSQADGAARITSLTTEGVLGALQQLGPEGRQLAEDLKFMRREQKYLGNVVYGSDTARNLKASDAEKLGSMRNGKKGLGPEIVGDAVATGVSGHFAPILTSARMVGNALKNVGAPRVSTLNDEARFLMARRNNVPGLPQPGTANFSPPPRNAFANNESGFVRPDAAGTLMTGAGATAGALNPLDMNNDGKKDWQDRAMTAALYGGAAYGAKRGLSAIENSAARSKQWLQNPDFNAAFDDFTRSFKPKKITREATEAELDAATARADEIMRQWYAENPTVPARLSERGNDMTTLGGFQAGAHVGASPGPDEIPVRWREEIARRILKSQGLDPEPMLVQRYDVNNRRTYAGIERDKKRLGAARAKLSVAERARSDPDFVPGDTKPPTLQGTATLGNDMANALVGGTVGGIGGSLSGNFNDYNGDGVIDEKDRQIGFMRGTAAGAFLAPIGTRIGVKGHRFDMKGGKLPNALKPPTSPKGISGGPRNPMRAELPGSPEWEAAKAKGLDMSQPARMQRAKDMGFDTDPVLYHGTAEDFQNFNASGTGTFGEGVYLTDNPSLASSYAEGRDGGNVIPVYVKGKIATEADVSEIGYAGGGRDRADLAYDKGFSGYMNEYADGTKEIVIFNPSNIRSVNAAFDPDMAASPMLTAGPSGMKPPRMPKLKPDVPKGRPPKGGNPKLGQGNLIRQQYEGTNPPRLPEGPMTDAQLTARKAREAAMPLIEQGMSGEAIRQQTGVQTLTYKGKTVILPPYLNGANNEAIHRFFYDSLKQPFNKRPKWVQNALRQMAGSEEDALAAQRAWDEQNPLQLGGQRTPMVKPGKNALSGE